LMNTQIVWRHECGRSNCVTFSGKTLIMRELPSARL
jgi:hypothetical protein